MQNIWKKKSDTFHCIELASNFKTYKLDCYEAV